MAVTVTMPQLGETVTEGTILSWAKQPGDTIAEDEVLLEISTDKVDTEVPSPAAGVIKEILVAEGETVSVGTPLAIIGEEGEASGDADASSGATEPPAGEPAAEPEAMEESEVDPGDEWPADGDAADGEATDGDAADEDETPETVEPESSEDTAPEGRDTGAPVAAAAAASLTPSDDSPRRGVLSPVVRKLAAEHDVDLESVTGTGEGGRITRKDVMSHVESGGAKVATEPGRPAEQPPAAETPAPAAAETPAPAAAETPAPAAAEKPPTDKPAPPAKPAAPDKPAVRPAAELTAGPGQEIVEIPRLRRRIAENLVVAKQTAAHVWTSVEVDYENVERVRQANKAAFKEREGFSLTYLPFISRATMEALSTYPSVNSAFHLDQGKQVMNSRVHLGIAVDVDQQGLVVVTLKNADGLRLTGVAREISAKATKARTGKLEPDDVSGSTFTITNPGPFGSFMSAPIINLPNAAILSTDTVAKRPTVVTLPDGTDTIAIRHIGYLGLTWDHRVFDGSTAVLFLQRIKQNLETWDWEQELA